MVVGSIQVRNTLVVKRLSNVPAEVVSCWPGIMHEIILHDPCMSPAY